MRLRSSDLKGVPSDISGRGFSKMTPIRTAGVPLFSPHYTDTMAGQVESIFCHFNVDCQALEIGPKRKGLVVVFR